MEKWFSRDGYLGQMVTNGWENLTRAGLIELIIALVIPLIAIVVAMQLTRWNARRPVDTFRHRAIKFLIGLAPSLLALAMLTVAAIALKGEGVELFVLPFVFKLAVAWFAITFVLQISSRQGAGWVITLVIIPLTLLHLFQLWVPLVDTLSEITFTIGKTELSAYSIVKSTAAVIALFWLAGVVVNTTGRWLQRSERFNISTRTLLTKFFQILLYFIVFMIGLQILGVDLTALSVLGGALGVGIGFGLQKIASNFISGIILLFERSVEVGDRIILDDGTSGIVRQTAARYTLLELFDGKKMFIPNEEFITNRVISLTHGSVRGRIMIPLSIAYESDIDLATNLLLQAAKDCPLCLEDPAPFAEMSGFQDSGIGINLFFWVPDVTKGLGGPTHAVMRNIIHLFREHGIDIPYPHQVAVNDPALVAQIDVLKTQLAASHTLQSVVEHVAEEQVAVEPKTRLTAKKPARKKTSTL